MKTSEKIGELVAALSKAQAEFTNPTKDKTASVEMKTGGKYSYQYSDLASLLDVARPILGKHGLALIQTASNEPGCVHIDTRLAHASGEWIEDRLTMPVGDNKPQTLGSAITYGRRYGAGAILGMASEVDDDGQAAQTAAPGKSQPRQAQRAAPPPSSGEDLYVGSDQQRQVLRAAFDAVPGSAPLPSDDRKAIAAAMQNQPMKDLQGHIHRYLQGKEIPFAT